MCGFNLTKCTCSNSKLVAKINGVPQWKKGLKTDLNMQATIYSD